jgi:hypothetical protein
MPSTHCMLTLEQSMRGVVDELLRLLWRRAPSILIFATALTVRVCAS